MITKKLEKIFYECDRHLLRINKAYSKLSNIMPLNSSRYVKLTDSEIETLDQFLFRFSKLQDTMGQKLFKNMLLFLGEDISNRPFIDILNIMEKLKLIDSVNDWRELREDRNELAHNYEDEPEEMSETINRLYNKKVVLEKIYIQIKNEYKQRVNNG